MVEKGKKSKAIVLKSIGNKKITRKDSTPNIITIEKKLKVSFV
jgi:hypothetical protein